MGQFLDKIIEWDKGTRIVRDVLFLILFVWQSTSYGYFENMDSFPDGTHVWRKCDGASLALNYSKKGVSLLEPQLHQLFEGSGKAVGEFPFFYYLVGKTYQVVGFSNEVFRWWWWGILGLGFYFLFQWFYLKTKSTTTSLLLNVYCFTPPILVYYGTEFLPDTIALSLSFGGLFFYEKWRDKPTTWNISLGVFFFSLAVLTKVSSGILLIAIASYEVVTMNKENYKHSTLSLLPWAIPFGLTIIWIQYAAWYNSLTNNVYFLLDTVPYWTLTDSQILKVKTNFMEYWYDELFAFKSLWLITVPFFAFGLLWLKRLRKDTVPIIVYSVLVFFFILLFFERFQDHDYYIICLYGILPLILVYCVSIVKSVTSNRLILVAVILFSAPYVAYNISAVRVIIENRTNTWNYYNQLDNKLSETDNWLTENGITKDTPILSVYDPSPNVSLYYMNRRGLSNIYNQELTEEFVLHAKTIGIKFLVVHGKGLKTEKEKLKYCKDTISSIGNIHLFKLN